MTSVFRGAERRDCSDEVGDSYDKKLDCMTTIIVIR